MSARLAAPLVVVGDTLLDIEVEGRVERVCPDAPVPVVDQEVERARPGGAGLAAVLAARTYAGERPVVLITALAPDAGGVRLRRLLAAAGVEVVDLGLDGETPEKVRVRAAGQSLVRLDRGGHVPGPVGSFDDEAAAVLGLAGAVVVADYGRGVTADPDLRAALEEVAAHRPLVWDPHPRGTEPVPGAWLVTPNRAEADRLAADLLPASTHRADELRRLTACASVLGDTWSARAVVVTRGDKGALLVAGGGPPLVAPAPEVAVGDPCGAGDRFAVAAGVALAEGAVHSEAVLAAVEAASRFVASGGAASVRIPGDTVVAVDETGGATAHAGTASADHPAAPAPAAGPRAASRRDPWADARAVVERVRAEGGTVVATGGCFDLLHVGHVSLLGRARALGDCLIVCLNSDESVSRLKGPGRPVVTEGDRAAVLEALSSVDAVAVFDESTPERVLAELRPDLFVKGGDYAGTTIPESRLLETWGGQAVVVPYLDGRSTSRILAQVLGHED